MAPPQHVFQQALEESIQAFWQSFVASFPTVESGDLSPGMSEYLHRAMERATYNWLQLNHPDGQFVLDLVNPETARIR